MKSIKYPVFLTVIIIFIFIIYRLLVADDNPSKLTKTPDSSFDTVTPEISKPKKTNTKQKVKSISIDVIATKADNAKNPVKELTYLAAYREYKFLLGCIPILQSLKSSQGFFASLIQKKSPLESFIELKKAMLNKEPSNLQIGYFQKHLDKCKSLTSDKYTNYFEDIAHAKTQYEAITPVTDDEIALSNALDILELINDNENKINNEKTGSEILTPEEKTKRKKQLLALSKEMELLMANTNGQQGINEDTLENLSLLMNKLNETIMPNANVMTDEIKYYQQEIQKYQLELSEFFITNQTPDVFLIFADILLNDNKGRNFINDEINEKLGIYDESYIKSLNKIIIPLVACSLDYPCDAESDISIGFCINSIEDHEVACGKNLEDYFLDYLLSKNQLIDVYNYLNYLLNKYV